MGYNPDVFASSHDPPTHPSIEEHLQTLQEAQENTLAAHQQAVAVTAKQATDKPVTFNKGDKVLLESTHLHLPYPYQKLAPKCKGPFEIEEVMGLVMFKLKLPKQWKKHLVFHAGLLTPYQTTIKHGPDYP